MRLVVIEAETMTYTVYEGKRMLAQYTCDRLLTASEIEELRCMKALPGVA